MLRMMFFLSLDIFHDIVHLRFPIRKSSKSLLPSKSGANEFVFLNPFR